MPEFDLINDGQHEVAQAEGPPRFSQPFPGDKQYYILEQDCTQFCEYFSPLALNTTHPDYAQYYLVSESPLQPVGVATLARWTRRYAKIPASRDDPTTYSYNFIGFFGPQASPLDSPVPFGRERFTRTVTCRVRMDYFLAVDGATIRDVLGTNVFTGTPNVTPIIQAIPRIREQQYYAPAGTLSGGVFVPDYTAGTDNDIKHGMALNYLFDSGGAILNYTIPSRTEYQALIDAETEIVAEESQVSRWEGNIYQRATKYVVAI